MFTRAIARKPGRNFAGGLTTAGLGTPDYDTIFLQHKDYVETLEVIGLEVTVLDALSGFPDAYFVEDTAVVFEEAAVLTRPGAPSRLKEAEEIRPDLEKYKTIHPIEAPGTIDGGDVLQMGRRFFVGISERTNKEGAEQFKSILSGYGYETTFVSVSKGLHFKSSVNAIGDEALILTREFADMDIFKGFDKLVLNDGEELAANTLRINDALVTPVGFPKVMEQLKQRADRIFPLDVSEVQKMDGGLTCLSLRF